MPIEAYPKNYKLGPDNQGWLNYIKFWWFQVPLTGGPRVTPASSFWHWRDIPKTLVAFKGKGMWRFENTDGSKVCSYEHRIAQCSNKHGDFHMEECNFYTSRIQPWTRWHFALMWPLGIHWSIIWRSKDVVKYPRYQSNFGIKKMIAGYLGWVRDSDKIYKPKLYIGGNFE